MLKEQCNNTQKYIIKIISQNSDTFILKNNNQKKQTSIDISNNTSQESTAIDNIKETSVIGPTFTQIDILTKEFFLSKSKALELPFNTKDISILLDNSDQNEHDPYYDESVLSSAFDSQTN